ncbi:glycosyltransferase [Undibacterium arcticum]
MAIEFRPSAPVVPAPEAEQSERPTESHKHADVGRRTDADLEALISAVAAAPAIPARATQAETKRASLYFSVRLKFTIATLGGLLWMSASIYLARPWFGELSQVLGPILAPVVIAGIAIIPGFMNAFLLTGLALDRRPNHARLNQYPAITILIAAYNEAANIVDTIQSIDRQAYPGNIEVIVINDGSKDQTAALVTQQMAQHPWLKLIDLQPNGGKAKALNRGLAVAKSSLVLTVDADSYLYHDALQKYRRTLFPGPAEHPRGIRHGAGAQFTPQLGHQGAGMGLFSRHCRDQARAVAISGHAGGAGRVLDI